MLRSEKFYKDDIAHAKADIRRDPLDLRKTQVSQPVKPSLGDSKSYETVVSKPGQAIINSDPNATIIGFPVSQYPPGAIASSPHPVKASQNLAEDLYATRTDLRPGSTGSTISSAAASLNETSSEPFTLDGMFERLHHPTDRTTVSQEVMNNILTATSEQISLITQLEKALTEPGNAELVASLREKLQPLRQQWEVARGEFIRELMEKSGRHPHCPAEFLGSAHMALNKRLNRLNCLFDETNVAVANIERSALSIPASTGSLISQQPGDEAQLLFRKNAINAALGPVKKD